MTRQRQLPIQVDIVAHLPESWGICSACELMLGQAEFDSGPATRHLSEYPPDWQETFARLSAWVTELSGQYGERIVVRVIDPRSPLGLWKSLRHGVRRYPTFLVGRQKILKLRYSELLPLQKTP